MPAFGGHATAEQKLALKLSQAACNPRNMLAAHDKVLEHFATQRGNVTLRYMSWERAARHTYRPLEMVT